MGWLRQRLSLPLIALPVLLAHAGCKGEPPSPEQVETGLFPQIRAAGDPTWHLEERMAHYGVRGVSIAVIEDFELAWARGYGIADPATGEPVSANTLFQAAEISTVVTALAALTNVRDGRMALDEPIDDVLSSWKIPGGSSVTLRQLLSHSGGVNVDNFRGYLSGDELPTLAQVLAGEMPANSPPVRVPLPPGSVYSFSSGAFAILQQALSDVAGKPFGELVRESVLDPLGMDRSTFEQPLPPGWQASAATGHRTSGEPVEGKGHVFPEMAATGLWSTPTDLARLILEIQRAARDGSGSILTSETVEELLAPGLENAGLSVFLTYPGPSVRFDMRGWSEGFTAELIAYPHQGQGAVVMTNSADGWQLTSEIFRAIARTYGWMNYRWPEVEPIEVAPDRLDLYTGRYDFGGGETIIVERQGGRLEVRRALARHPDPLCPVAENAFFNQRSGLRITFRRDRDGRATAYSFQANEYYEQVYTRLRDHGPRPTELLLADRIPEALAAYRRLGPIPEYWLDSVVSDLFKLGKVEAAIAVRGLGTEFRPSSAESYFKLGQAYLDGDDGARAAVAFRQVLRKLPDDPLAEEGLRERLYAQARYQLVRLGEWTGGLPPTTVRDTHSTGH